MVDNPFEHIFYEVDMYRFSIQLLNIMSKKKVEDRSLEEQQLFNMVVDNHALHLRNLAKFFSIRTKNTDYYWRANDYLNDSADSITLDVTLGKEIQDYTSQSTCHLLEKRLEIANKTKASECYSRAFTEVELAIKKFLAALDSDVNDDYKDKWADIRPLVVPLDELAVEDSVEGEKS